MPGVSTTAPRGRFSTWPVFGRLKVSKNGSFRITAFRIWAAVSELGGIIGSVPAAMRLASVFDSRFISLRRAIVVRTNL